MSSRYKNIGILITFSLLSLFLFLTGPASGVHKPEEGFKGIPWGANINTINGMEQISSQEGIDIYTKKNDILQFYGEKVDTIEYYFYKKKFMGASISFHGFFRFSAIKKSMFKHYGPGKKENYFLNDFSWLKRDLLITLNYTARTNNGFITYCYLPLWDKR